MDVLTNPQQIQVFNIMVQFCKCFIKRISFVMAPIIKFTRKTNQFMWTSKVLGNLGVD